MKPKSRSESSQLQLFQAQFDQVLNHDHPLFMLAGQIDWPRFESALADCYSPDQGAPAKAVRLLVGLHYLKHTFDESDESVVDHWIENSYWQYFCGFETMQHELPLHPTSMTKWRQRVGAEKLSELLGKTLALALCENQATEQELAQVNVDTTVQEKNVTYPTDSKLLHKAIVKLGQAAKKASIQAGRYAHAKQFKHMRRQLKKLRTYLGRVIRDLRRKLSEPDEALETLLLRCERLHAQQPGDKNKLYSLHEPEVKCISKGKARQRYEFGQTQRRIAATGLLESSFEKRTLTMATRSLPLSLRSSKRPAYRLPTRTSIKAIEGTTIKERQKYTSLVAVPKSFLAVRRNDASGEVLSNPRLAISRVIIDSDVDSSRVWLATLSMSSWLRQGPTYSNCYAGLPLR